MKIAVIGLGYIGLPTALILASHGQTVVGVDVSEELVATLSDGKVTFKEEGLEELFEDAVKNDIQFVSEYPVADVYIVSLPTPYIKASKKLDSSLLIQALEVIVEIAPKNATIIIESTISPGTIDRDIRPILEKAGRTGDEALHLAHAPERILPGRMIYELYHNARTIGVDDAATGVLVQDIYSSFCKAEITLTDIRTAELSKVVENTFRDINIAFANELAMICYEADVNVFEVIRIANKHPRVNILQPGPGVGGHCISVDPWFLVGDFPQTAKLISQARQVNDAMPLFVIKRVEDIMQQEGLGDWSRVGFYGLTYKENVDDVRESPSLQLLAKLDAARAEKVLFFDPYVKKQLAPRQVFDAEAFWPEIDFVVIMVSHHELLQDLDRLRDKIVLDTRHSLPDQEIKPHYLS